MRKTLTRLFSFVKDPKDDQLRVGGRIRLGEIGILLLWEVLFVILFIWPSSFLLDHVLDLRPSAYTEQDYDLTILYATVVFCIAGPFLEELIFRYPLRYKGLIATMISSERWKRLFPAFVYTSTIAFGLMHIINYDNNGFLFYLASPVLVSSQLLGGFIMAYIRIRFSFFYGFLYHGVWNFLFAVVFPIVYFSFASPIVDINENYELRIQQYAFYDAERGRNMSIDSGDSNFYAIEIKQFLLHDALDSLYGQDRFYAEGVFIDLQLSSEKGITKEELLDRLKEDFDIKENL